MTTSAENEDEPLFMSPRHGEAAEACARLQAILDGPRVGEVDGVVFDFRNDKLPSAEQWHAPGGARSFGIAFPWDRTLFDGDAVAVEHYVTNGASERGWGVTHIYPGDFVSVDRMKRLSRGVGKPPYVDAHDAYSIEAYLIVTRPNGTVEKIKYPISFNARDAMGPASPHIYSGDDGQDEYVGDFRVSYEKVARRMERLMVSNEVQGEGVEWANLARVALDSLSPHWAVFCNGPLSRTPEDGPYLIDIAVALGYALAKAEAAPLVESAHNRTRSATKARVARSDPVREAAKEYIRAYPKTTQTACARQVAIKLERDQRSVEKIIAPLFVMVTLPGGAREKRPRSV